MDEKQIAGELEQVQSRIAALTDELGRLTEVEGSLQTLLAHVTGQPMPGRGRRDRHRERGRGHLRAGGPRRGRSRTFGVERLLVESDRALDRQEITEALSAVLGEPVDVDEVSASLSYLRRSGRARNDEGLWSAGEDASD